MRRDALEEIGADRLFAGWSEAARRAVLGLREGPPPRRLPRALEPGMTVGLVLPSFHLVEPDRYRIARETIESLGFRTVWSPDVERRRGYLAGDDAARARELERMFEDPAVDAVWCLRGGAGAQRILPLLDYETIRRNPKPFIGFSDACALHAAIGKLTGLVTFHGPMPVNPLSGYAVLELGRVLGSRAAAGRVGAPPPFEAAPGRIDREHRLITIAPGRATGRLAGGNLSVLCRLLGTPFEPETEGRILFLEDDGEASYRIDAMLAQLRASGKLGAAAGIAFGRFTSEAGPASGALPLETVLRDHTEGLGIPVLYGLACGHVPDQTTLPYATLAELDASAGTLTLLEPAVA